MSGGWNLSHLFTSNQELMVPKFADDARLFRMVKSTFLASNVVF